MIKYLLNWLRPKPLIEIWPIRLPVGYASASGKKVTATKAKIEGGKVVYEITWE